MPSGSSLHDKKEALLDIYISAHEKFLQPVFLVGKTRGERDAMMVFFA